tara:strand:+ start:566 stop:1498 length:933 start_codon:yes stop_codon:yes gene_type:complete
MKLIKPKFWLERNLFSYILYPFSIITYLINLLKKNYIKKKFKIKIICIGNIYVGGTGKTSLSIELSQILKRKFKVVFIKKNYKNQKDEINLLKKKGSVISNINRLKSLKISENKKFEIALLDDGLQQKNIKYNLRIFCFNVDEGLGNGFLFPAGPLRENISEIKQNDLVFFNGDGENLKLYKKIKSVNKNIKIFRSTYKPLNLNKLNRKMKYLMFCGIGNPQEFEKTLLKNKFKIKKKIIFPDHYEISRKEIKIIKETAKKKGLNIITTEKDYYRLSKNQRKGLKVLKIKLEIQNLDKFKKILFSINEKN